MGSAPSRFRNDDQEQTMRTVANANYNRIKARDPPQNQGRTESKVSTIKGSGTSNLLTPPSTDSTGNGYKTWARGMQHCHTAPPHQDIQINNPEWIRKEDANNTNNTNNKMKYPINQEKSKLQNKQRTYPLSNKEIKIAATHIQRLIKEQTDDTKYCRICVNNEHHAPNNCPTIRRAITENKPTRITTCENCGQTKQIVLFDCKCQNTELEHFLKPENEGKNQPIIQHDKLSHLYSNATQQIHQDHLLKSQIPVSVHYNIPNYARFRMDQRPSNAATSERAKKRKMEQNTQLKATISKASEQIVDYNSTSTEQFEDHQKVTYIPFITSDSFDVKVDHPISLNHQLFTLIKMSKRMELKMNTIFTF